METTTMDTAKSLAPEIGELVLEEVRDVWDATIGYAAMGVFPQEAHQKHGRGGSVCVYPPDRPAWAGPAGAAGSFLAVLKKQDGTRLAAVAFNPEDGLEAVAAELRDGLK